MRSRISFAAAVLALLAHCPSAFALGGVLARAISVSGDSISRAFDADTGSCNYGDNVSRNWATGDNHGGSYCSAGSGGTFSHAERLECNANADVTVFNDAVSGGDMLHDFAQQSGSIRAHLTSVAGPRYALVLMGHNDACTSTLSRTGNSCGGDRDPNNYCRTTNAAFEREFRAGMDQLIQIAGLRLGVLATVRVSELCNFRSKNSCGATLGVNCSAVWGTAGFLEDVFGSGGICASLTDDCSDQRRIDMYNTLVGYNEILSRVSAEYEAIPVGGTSASGAVKASDVHIKYGDGTFYYKFSSGDLSCCDCFHPSDQGQARLADFVWNGMQCSSASPCCADSGTDLNKAKCEIADTTTFHPGGFWPNDVACPNGLLEPAEQCDDGNSADGDCCSPICTYELEGVPCISDGNVCTNDVCTATGTCTHPTNSNPCNDGNACTGTDQCQNGTCVGSNQVVCSAQDQCHVAGTCSPATGTCSNPAAADGTSCNDANACTQTDTCQGGACAGANPVTCSALDQCHDAGMCNTATGVCSNPAKANGTTCADGNACTQTDTCQGGACTGTNPATCTAFDQCHNAGTCNTATGVCSNPAKPNGSACTDGNACTRTDTCQGGACAGANPVVCSALDQCHDAGTCSTTTGTCSNPAKADGSACSDNNPCTLADQCLAGACDGVSDACGDGQVQAQCNEQCDDGASNGIDECCSEICQPVDGDGDGSCDAEDPCTGPAPTYRNKLAVSGIDTTAADDTLILKAEIKLPYPFDPPFDPSADGLRIMLSDATATVLDVALAGGPLWEKDSTGTKWRYDNRDDTPPGSITRVLVRKSDRALGAFKISIKGRDGSYPVSSGALPLSAMLVFDQPTAASGQCGTVEFPGPAPMPTCVVDGGGERISCR